MADAPTNGNGYVRFGTVATTIAACLGAVGSIAIAIWFAITIAIAPMQRETDQNQQEIKDIRTDLVPRREHDRDWAAQDQRFADLERQIQDNKNHTEAIYTPGDAIKRLQDKIDQLEIELREDRAKKP